MLPVRRGTAAADARSGREPPPGSRRSRARKASATGPSPDSLLPRTALLSGPSKPNTGERVGATGGARPTGGERTPLAEQPMLPDYGGACVSNIAAALLEPGDEVPSWMPPEVVDADQVVFL